ncbi:MAG: molybdenum cofactor guanylyltransferase [Flavobacteriaceae bacterium]|nr:MAG: molybdenum cofactor guanylyltransferase [Flavobacteriaceae bacterium]
MKKHSKHSRLTRRNNDNYAPNEIAILGTNCENIAALVSEVSKYLKRFKMAYLDASHKKDQEVVLVDRFVFHPKGSLVTSVNKGLNTFNQVIDFSNYDFTFINGNHYKGSKQILILDPNKEASVLKRLEELDQLQFVIKLNEDAVYFDFLEAKYPQIKNLKCYHFSDTKGISSHISALIEEKIAPVKGLVLAGGKSVRMGSDKGLLEFYGKAQRTVAIALLEKQHLQTFLSIRSEQEVLRPAVITDVFTNLGPFGAICSAFQKDPNTAWLVLATDLPFITDELIQLLLKKRDPSKIATAIKGKTKQFMEPLVTIWEPRSYPILLNYLSQGISCPRKVLINSEVAIVEVEDDFIRNINTPEEFDAAKNEIGH